MVLSLLFMVSIVCRDHSCKYYLSLRKAIRSYLCCLFLSVGVIGSSGQESCPEQQQRYGILVFRIDEYRWFDITIDLPGHPKTAQEVEEQRNRDVHLRKSGRPDPPAFFPGANEITEGIRLRFHYRFK
ncbi:hypothetical protein [Endozoicomonas euniceicola]|uniref:TonB C-terminal domain-containing protein n=1 Tax=Endozoicomonas euniceicola TaxID=1234143 RepID=A0ABY6GYY6_9GAMM|nr:hypothetical protein [Endozoicomonas euniceicola]UYM18012.1 hypothetical protein NX720_08935 [Endozoicomonas euniceicola]